MFIVQDNTLIFVRQICRTYGGNSKFEFHHHEIRNYSVRSGIAMSLFLKDHSPEKIMLLGRWMSNAFLVYIRTQVTEWCELYSIDMISFNNYFEIYTTTKQ